MEREVFFEPENEEFNLYIDDNEIEYYLFRNPLNNDELNTLPRFIYKLSNNKLEKVYFEMNFVVESIKKLRTY